MFEDRDRAMPDIEGLTRDYLLDPGPKAARALSDGLLAEVLLLSLELDRGKRALRGPSESSPAPSRSLLGSQESRPDRPSQLRSEGE